MTAPSGDDDPEPEIPFATFYRARIGKLVAFGKNRGLDPEAALDVAQETMAEVYRNWTELHPSAEGARTAYAVMIMRYRSLDELRRAGQQRALVAAMAANVRAAPADPADRVVALDLLRHLTGMQLTVMSLLCEGLRVSEIAEHLGLPPSTISSHANKARNILRRKDNDHG